MKCYESILNIDPDHKDAKRSIDRIKGLEKDLEELGFKDVDYKFVLHNFFVKSFLRKSWLLISWKKNLHNFLSAPLFFLPSSCQLRILLFSPFIHWFRSMKKNPEMFEKFKAFVESEKEKKRRESMENQSMLDLLNNSLKRERKRSTSRYVRYYKYIILLLDIYVL